MALPGNESVPNWNASVLSDLHAGRLSPAQAHQLLVTASQAPVQGGAAMVPGIGQALTGAAALGAHIASNPGGTASVFAHPFRTIEQIKNFGETPQGMAAIGATGLGLGLGVAKGASVYDNYQINRAARQLGVEAGVQYPQGGLTGRLNDLGSSILETLSRRPSVSSLDQGPKLRTEIAAWLRSTLRPNAPVKMTPLVRAYLRQLGAGGYTSHWLNPTYFPEEFANDPYLRRVMERGPGKGMGFSSGVPEADLIGGISNRGEDLLPTELWSRLGANFEGGSRMGITPSAKESILSPSTSPEVQAYLKALKATATGPYKRN